MRLSWNEVRVRAASFAKEWRDAAYEQGETQSFRNDFLREPSPRLLVAVVEAWWSLMEGERLG